MSATKSVPSQHGNTPSISQYSLSAAFSNDSSQKSTAQQSTSGMSFQIEEEKPTEKGEQTNLDIRIISAMLLGILDEAIYKSKVVICLPDLKHEKALLLQTLTLRQFSELQAYSRRSFLATIKSSVVFKMDSSATMLNSKNRSRLFFQNLLRIVQDLHQRKDVQEFVEEFIENKLKSEEFCPSLEYLKTLMLMRDVMSKQLDTTAAERLGEKLRFKFTDAINNGLIREINEIENQIQEEKRTFENEMTRKLARTEHLRQELDFLQRKCNMVVDKTILDTERQMVLATRAHRMRYEILTEEEQAWIESNAQQLQRNLQEEKKLRTRRTKTYTQLLTWVQKYDLEMEDKRKELDEMIQNLNEETDKVADLEAKLEEQDKEYIPLMEEREKEYDEEMTTKMMKFKRDHAARVLQHAWNTVLWMRKEKARRKRLARKLEKEAAKNK